MDVPGGLLRDALDRHPTEIAILDASGEIVYTNDEWYDFAVANELRGTPSSIGRNYLDVADDADEHAREATARLRRMLSADLEEFQLEYPCHSPDERRWFLMHARRFDHGGDRFVLVAHVDITERKLAEIEVREQNDRLESVAAILSHDLRNPLNVAMGRLDILDDRLGDADELVEVRSALDRMNDMVDDALSLARGRTVDDVEAVELSEAAEAAWRNVDTRNASLDVAGSVRFDAEPGLVRNLLENLYRNAVEHAREDVTVRVGSLDSEGFYVEDDGPGVPHERRDEVFDPGVSTGEDAGNTGLGLAIVREIASSHGWDARLVDSEAGGARFEFRGLSTRS